MKIHVTKAGKTLIVVIIIGIGIFLACGGVALLGRIIEKYRVNAIENIREYFLTSDISYKDMKSLREAFRKRYKDIDGTIEKIKDLKKTYPDNKALSEKLARYEKYKQSMSDALIPCPQHKNQGTEVKWRNCSQCKGRGTVWIVKTCGNCSGTGKTKYREITTVECRNCGSSGEAGNISGHSLLN